MCHVDNEGWRLSNPLGIAIIIQVISTHIDSQIYLRGTHWFEIPTERASLLVGQVGSLGTIIEWILGHTPPVWHSQVGNNLQWNIAGVFNLGTEDELFSGR